MSYIVNGTLRNWDKNYAKGYRSKGGQFEHQLLHLAWDYPPYQIGNDEAEYLAQRSLLFTFEVYNPQTKKGEIKDLSSFIQQDVDVSKQQRTIKNAAKIINQRRQQLAKKGITADICAQMQQGSLPDNYTTQEPAPQPQQQQQASQQQPQPQAKPKDNKLTLDQQISPSPQPQNSGDDIDDDFKTPYRRFYQQKAKQEGSVYTEDTANPDFNATLERANGEELSITATKDNHASLSAKSASKQSKIPDYADFDDLVKFAVAQGKNIRFGNIKTPEYKARLLLACLANQINAKDFPSFKELQDIEPETRRRLMQYKSQYLKLQKTNSQPDTPSDQHSDTPKPKPRQNPRQRRRFNPRYQQQQNTL